MSAASCCGRRLHKLPVGNEPNNSLRLAVFSFNTVQPSGRFGEQGRVHRKLIYTCCRQLFRNHRYTCRAGALPIKHVMPTAVWLQEQRSPRTLNQRVSCSSKVWQPWINSSPATAKPNVELTRDQKQQILTTLNQRQTTNSKVLQPGISGRPATVKHDNLEAAADQQQQSMTTLKQRQTSNSKAWQPWSSGRPATVKHDNLEAAGDQQQ